MIKDETSEGLAIEPARYFHADEFMVAYDILQTDTNAIANVEGHLRDHLKTVTATHKAQLKSLPQPITSTRLYKYGNGPTPTSTLLLFTVKLEQAMMKANDFLHWLNSLEERLLTSVTANEKLSFVSPNWYTTSSAPSIGGGMAEIPEAVFDAPANPQTLDFDVPLLKTHAVPADGPGPVQVFVLDTRPYVEDAAKNPLDDTVPIRQWVGKKHYPLSRGYKEAVPAGITGALNTVPSTLKAKKMEGKDVPFHGLFVAGIISALAPDVEITSLEVLNRGGVGNMNTLFECIAYIDKYVRDNPTVPVIVNCSMTIYAAADAEQVQLENRMAANRERIYETSDPETNHEIYETMKASMLKWLGSLAEGFLPPSVVVIAAAGNDGRDAKKHALGILDSRYPARFDHVIGVSSLNKDKQTRAEYSNRADGRDPRGANATPIPDTDPRIVGFTTLGDIKSLYMTPLAAPEGVNATPIPGLAQWKGTSFSAAVVTGVLARLLQTTPKNPSVSAEKRLNDALAIMTDNGNAKIHKNAGGYILDVTQDTPAIP